MASSNIARLGVVLGLDTAEFTAEIDKAIAANQKMARDIKRDTNAAAGEIIALKYATEDYGKTLTKVQQIEREITSGRFMKATDEMKQRLRESAAAYDAVANSAKKTTFQMSEQQKMQLGFQMTDFVTQIASGQNAMIAFIQQGGQLKDSMGGIGNAIKAIASVFTPLRVAIGGAAAAAGLLAFAFYKGDQEADAFNDSLALTNKYAGITYKQFNDLSKQLSGETSTSIGMVKEALQAVVASGQYTSSSILAITNAITTYAKIAGVTGKEAADKLMSGLDGTAAGAKRLNDQMNFLTLAQYKQIEALEIAGKKQEAAQVAALAMNKMLETQRRELGYLEKSWNAVQAAASNFWNWLKGIGAPEESSKAVTRLKDEIVGLEFALKKSVGTSGADQNARKQIQAQIDAKKAELESILETQRLLARSQSGVVGEKGAINQYADAGGAQKQKQILAELAKTKYEVAIKTAMETADEDTRIQLEAALKVQEEIAKYQAISDKEKAVFGAQLYEQMMLKVQATLAERDRKLHDAEKKRQWDKDLKAFEEETNIKFRLMDEFAAARNKVADDKTALEIARKKLDLQNEMIGATEKERQIALSRLDYEQKIAVLKNSEKFRNASVSQQQELLDAEEANQTLIESNIQVADSLKKIQETSSVVWSNMSTMIDNFIKTGKLGFKDFARSVIQDLLAIQLKMATVGFLNQAFSAMGMSFQLPGRATGGPVSGNSPYMVGEKGPELFIPSGSGTIVPNNQLTNMAPVTNVTNYNINAIDAKSFETRLLESSNTIWAANQYAGKNLATNYGRT